MTLGIQANSYRLHDHRYTDPVALELLKLLCFENIATLSGEDYTGSAMIPYHIRKQLIAKEYVEEGGEPCVYSGRRYRLTRMGTNIAANHVEDPVAVGQLQPEFRKFALHSLELKLKIMEAQLAELPVANDAVRKKKTKLKIKLKEIKVC